MLKLAGFPWVGEDLIHNLLYHTVVVLPMAGGVYKTVWFSAVKKYCYTCGSYFYSTLEFSDESYNNSHISCWIPLHCSWSVYTILCLK